MNIIHRNNPDMQTCVQVCEESEGPDQSMHPHSLIRAFCPLTESLDIIEYMNGEQRPG